MRREDPAVPELINLREAAAELGVSPQLMRTRAGTGGRASTWRLVSTRIGRRRAYRAADITAVAAGSSPSTEPLPALLTLTETAEQLGTTHKTLHACCLRGHVPTHDLGHALVMRQEVADYLAAAIESLADPPPRAGELPEGLSEPDRVGLWQAARRILDTQQ